MKEAKSSLKRRFQRWLITKTLMLLIRITGNTTRIKSNNQKILKTTLQEYGSVIVATWHQNIFQCLASEKSRANCFDQQQRRW